MQQTQQGSHLSLQLATVKTQNDTTKQLESESSRRNVSDSTEDSEVSTSLEWLEELELLITSSEIDKQEKFNEILIQVNDQAVNLVSKGKNQEALTILERIEKLLETAAGYGIGLDRSLVIVVLYNIAACYQAAWILENCSKYTDGVIFNLIESLMNEETNYKSQPPNQISLGLMQNYHSTRLKKQQFLLRVYLQHCAVLSQLAQHENAVDLIDKAMKLLRSMLESALECCQTIKRHINPRHLDSSKKTGFGLRPASAYVDTIGSIDLAGSRKNSAPNLLSKEEVHYVQSVLDFAIPFLKEFMSVTENPLSSENTEIYKDIKKFIFNWKNNPEYNEKYLRKEIQKNAIVIQETQARTLLGVQQTNDWLQNFNIGTVMHMKPIKFSEYTQKRDLVGEVTKEALQEKVIYMSLVLFATATEMRFLEATVKEEETAEDKKGKQLTFDGQKQSEKLHLQSIGVVCRYTNGSCPYINHLILSYHKHYSQGLETIPEESFLSMPSEAKSFYKEGSDNEEKKYLAELTRETSKKGSQKESPKKPVDQSSKQLIQDTLSSQIVRSSSMKEILGNSSKAPVNKNTRTHQEFSPDSSKGLLKSKELSKASPSANLKKEDKKLLLSQQANAQRAITSPKSQKQSPNITNSNSKLCKEDISAKGQPISAQSSKKTLPFEDDENITNSRFYLKKEFHVPTTEHKTSVIQTKPFNKTMPINISNQSLSRQSIKDLTAPCIPHNQHQNGSAKHQQDKKAIANVFRVEGSKTERLTQSVIESDIPSKKSDSKASEGSNFQIQNNFQEFFQKLYQAKKEESMKPSVKSSREKKVRTSPSDRTKKAAIYQTYTYESPSKEAGLTPQKQEQELDKIRESMVPLHKSQPTLYDSTESIGNAGMKHSQTNFSKKDPKSLVPTRFLAENTSQQKFSKLAQPQKNPQLSKNLNMAVSKAIPNIDTSQLKFMRESQKLESQGSLSSRSIRTQVNTTKKK